MNRRGGFCVTFAWHLTLIILLFCLASHTVSAAKQAQSQGAINSMPGESALYALESEAEAIQSELQLNLSALDPKSTLVVAGDSMSAPEKAGLAFVQSRTGSIFSNAVAASKTNFSAIEKSGKVVILVGGPSQNRITAEFSEKGMLSAKKHEFANQFTITTGKTKYGTKIIVVSDKRGFVNLPRKAAQYSPLALCLPLQWIPVVASAIGAILASIISPLINLLKAYIEAFLADKGKKGKHIDEKAVKVAGIKIREVISVMVAAFVLGLSTSWTFAGPTFDFVWLLILNTIICLFAGLSHELIHLTMGRLLKIKTEYRFWPAGSAATMLTAILGNSFGLQGFLLEKVEEGAAKWKLGVMKLASPLFSTAVMIFFAIVNFFFPHVAFQMVYTIAGVLAMADILPFAPMDGHEIRKWNIFVWLITFAVISCSFVFVNFIL